jgi:hypothetical protein
MRDARDALRLNKKRSWKAVMVPQSFEGLQYLDGLGIGRWVLLDAGSI